MQLQPMPRAPSDSVQLAIRVPTPWLKRFDKLAAALSRPGIGVTRTDAVRAAIARGLEVLEAEIGPSQPTAIPELPKTLPEQKPAKKSPKR